MGVPSLDPTVLNTGSMLLSLYDINGNNVSTNIMNTMSNSTQIHIRSPVNNVNEIFFTVGNGTQDTNQFILTDITLINHFGSFTAENMYYMEFMYPVKLSQQQDVYINDPQDGDVLTFKTSDSNHWINQQPQAGSSALADDTDVNINNLTLGDGQVLTYYVTDTKWENKDPNKRLEGLTDDVTITSPSGGQLLTYNGTSNIWTNQTFLYNVMSIGQLKATDWYDYIIPTGTLIDITSNPCVINSNNDLMLNPVWNISGSPTGTIQYLPFSVPCTFFINIQFSPWSTDQTADFEAWCYLVSK